MCLITGLSGRKCSLLLGNDSMLLRGDHYPIREGATAVMEMEDVEGTRDQVHRLDIVQGTRQVQENCGQISAVCGRNVSVNDSSSST